jgi:hypothetical protein
MGDFLTRGQGRPAELAVDFALCETRSYNFRQPVSPLREAQPCGVRLHHDRGSHLQRVFACGAA